MGSASLLSLAQMGKLRHYVTSKATQLADSIRGLPEQSLSLWSLEAQHYASGPLVGNGEKELENV